MTRDHQNLIAASPHASNSELARAIGCDPKTVAAFRQWRDANNNKGGAGVWYGESRLDAKAQEPQYLKMADPGSESEWKAARRQREKHKRRVKT